MILNVYVKNRDGWSGFLKFFKILFIEFLNG